KIEAPMIFLTPTPYYEQEKYKGAFPLYVKAMREMANSLHVDLVDLHDIVRKDLDGKHKGVRYTSGDQIHYENSYYKKLAEYIFANGLMNRNIKADENMFFDSLDEVFIWDDDNHYFESDINPVGTNIYLDQSDSDYKKVTVYLFVVRNDLGIQTYFVVNKDTSASNTMTINRTSHKTTTTVQNSQTICNLNSDAHALDYE